MTSTKQVSSFLATFYHHYVKAAFYRFRKLSLAWKLVLAAILSFYTAVAVVIIVLHPARVAQYFYDLSQRISGHPLGWLLLSGMIAIEYTDGLLTTSDGKPWKRSLCASHGTTNTDALADRILERQRPPLDGAYPPFALPSMGIFKCSILGTHHLGESLAPEFMCLVYLLKSIKAVSIWQFMIATICIFPRFLLYVFIGSRLAALSDGDQRAEMDTQTKVINGLFVAGGIVVGVVAGWIVYSLMEKELRGVSPEIDELAAEAIEEADEGAPLLDNLSA
ncbi:hypothetical protein EVG20_g254 [Dentipellis fragilis]|uniref:Golgi apparatus membrane protein TVP38 n=1 Tax=Dentipellis fragilis TaxID=205917 RepID=A0A4Y9ZFS9_9AGAM|nr:hypothetical protein EVG20_g254 [Dentipellis fragilis]